MNVKRLTIQSAAEVVNPQTLTHDRRQHEMAQFQKTTWQVLEKVTHAGM